MYINGLPYVLREVVRPMKNLQEYAGIDAKRLERMEGRLKADVLAEAGGWDVLGPSLCACFVLVSMLSSCSQWRGNLRQPC